MLLRKMMMAKTSAPPLAVSGTFGTPVDNGDPLTGSLTITGGVAPYSVSVYSGTAPPGVTFSVSGSSVVASGNTTTNGSYSWTLRVTSTDGQHADSAQSVTVETSVAESWDALKKSSDVTLTNSDKTASVGAGSFSSVLSITGHEASTASHYFEVKCDAKGSGNQMHIGIGPEAVALDGDPRYMLSNRPYYHFNLGGLYFGSSGGNYSYTFTTGDIIGICVKSGSVYFRKNGVWRGNPSAGTGADYTGVTGEFFAFLCQNGGSPGSSATGRFTAADLTYSIPTGCTAWDGTT